MRYALATFGLFAALVVPALAAEKPNILFIAIDDQKIGRAHV